METRKIRSTSFILQLVIVVLASMLLLWLINVEADAADQWWKSLLGELSQNSWVILLFILFGVLIVAQILLLLPWWKTIRQTGNGENIPVGNDRVFGCTSCGTIFRKQEHEVDEPHEQNFACPNCDRAGMIRGAREANPEFTTCGNCNHVYEAFLEQNECPQCHTVNSANSW